jgi:streptogramin lyase
MPKAIKCILLLAAVISVAVASQAAEIVKLKPMVSLYADAKGEGLRTPEGIGCDDKSRLVVADTGNGRLLEFTYNGETWTPGPAINLPQLPYPMRVQLNTKGEIYALDGKLRKIARLGPKGNFQGYVEGSGASASNVPRSFKIDTSDNILILDILTENVLVLDASGKVLKKIPFPKEYGFISDLAVDAVGNVFLVDSVKKMVYSAPKNSTVFSSLTEKLEEDLDFPTSITTDDSGRIYLVDQNGGGIVILGRDGSYQGRQLRMGWKEGFLRYPSQICINKKGEVFIADRENSRVQVFSITK